MKSMIPIALILTSFLGACGIFEPNERVVGTGPVVTSTIDVENFDKVQSTGIANVNIIESGSQVVNFSAQSEILEVMTYEVDQGTLILGFEENVNIKTSKDITIDIEIPRIEAIFTEGTGDWHISGSLQEELIIDVSGTGDVHAYDQPLTNCDIYATGTGSAWIYVENQLDVDLTGTGNVHYKGRPIINADISGTGKVISGN